MADRDRIACGGVRDIGLRKEIKVKVRVQIYGKCKLI